MTTIFGKIIAGELPAEKVFENDRILAIKDINPQAPIHFLIMPKKEISSIQEMKEEDFPLLGEMVHVAQELAKKYNVSHGYRLLTNIGRDAGQTVFHFHLHLIGGRHLGPMA